MTDSQRDPIAILGKKLAEAMARYEWHEEGWESKALEQLAALREKLAETESNLDEAECRVTQLMSDCRDAGKWEQRGNSLEQANTRLREALEKHGIHDDGCKSFVLTEDEWEQPCDCGLAAALAHPGTAAGPGAVQTAITETTP